MQSKISLIIPTYNEAENIRPLLARIDKVNHTNPLPLRILFVDDSTDDTPEIVRAEMRLRDKQPHLFPVDLIHRTRSNGLAGAILEGFKAVDSEYLITMDADLQHPPELIPQIVDALLDGADLVIPTRYTDGGSDQFGMVRGALSRVGGGLGRLLVPRLRKVSDCTGGFFALRSTVVNSPLVPQGWKLLVEIVAKGTYEKIVEIPYSFGERTAGQSKIGPGVYLAYLRQLFRLSPMWDAAERYLRFSAVGLTGLVVNLLVFEALNDSWGMAASYAASLVAMGFNYLINSTWTWRGVGGRRGAAQAAAYAMIAGAGVGLTGLISWWVHICGLQSVEAQAIGAVSASIFTYAAHTNVTFNAKWQNSWIARRIFQSSAESVYTQDIQREVGGIDGKMGTNQSATAR